MGVTLTNGLGNKQSNICYFELDLDRQKGDHVCDCVLGQRVWQVVMVYNDEYKLQLLMVVVMAVKTIEDNI